MDIRQAVTAFGAMDRDGHKTPITKDAMLYNVAGPSGFCGRTEDIASLASFVYFGAVYCVSKDVLSLNTKLVVYASRLNRKAASA